MEFKSMSLLLVYVFIITCGKECWYILGHIWIISSAMLTMSFEYEHFLLVPENKKIYIVFLLHPNFFVLLRVYKNS